MTINKVALLAFYIEHKGNYIAARNSGDVNR